MKKDISIGLLGFGSMGQVHSYCVDNLKYFYPDLPFSASIKGICTTSLEKSEKIAEKYSFDISAASEDELIYRNAVHENKQTSPDFSDGAYVQAIIDAAYLSDAESRTVKISEIQKRYDGDKL